MDLINEHARLHIALDAGKRLERAERAREVRGWVIVKFYEADSYRIDEVYERSRRVIVAALAQVDSRATRAAPLSRAGR